MRMKILGLLAVLGAVNHVPRVSAAAPYSGLLDGQTNPALVGSDLDAPLFGDDHYISNGVAVYAVSVALPASVTFVMDTGPTPAPEAPPAWLMTLALLGLTVARGTVRHVA